MKRLSLATIFACCMLAVAAQEGIQVKYQGAKPTIRDFAEVERSRIQLLNACNKRLTFGWAFFLHLLLLHQNL